MSSENHPLPPAPTQQFPPAQQNQKYPPQAHARQQQYQQRQQPQQQQQQQQASRPEQQQQRPRAKSNFSFHSRKSSGSDSKTDYVETHEEKEARRLHTKADPSMALSEAEPSAVASGVKSSLAPIRAMQYRDGQGNPIADPDRSNPTRSRWERPLDTIRSFEAAIDGNYKRQSYMRAESADAANYNRRSSYYGGTQVNADERPRYPHNGYYGGGRSHSNRGESQYMDHRQSFYNNYNNNNSNSSHYHNNSNHNVINNDHGGPSNAYAPNRARYPRTASEPHFGNGQGVYPAHGNQHSYETVTTASGSGSSDPAGYSTDPSSENSSVDRITPLPPAKDAGEHYGVNGQHGGPQNLTPGFKQHSMNGQGGAQRQGGNSYQNQGQPQVPRKEVNAPRVPMKLGKSSGNAQIERPAPAEKRKSWFGKRFSKA